MATTMFDSPYGVRPKTIEVPLQQENVLEVVCSDLPSNPKELTDIFRQESVELPYYRTLAVEYYRQNKIEQSIQVVQAGLDYASQSSRTLPRQKLPLLNLRATLYLRLARYEKDDKKREEYLNSATQCINESDRIHNQYEPSFLIKGNLYLQRRKIDDAARSFSMVLEKRPNCIPALLGQAKIQYHLQRHKAALITYQTALKYARGKYSGVEIRLGIATCFAKLKMYSEAKAALRRVLDVSPQSDANALILLSIIELNESKQPNTNLIEQETALEHGIQHLREAYMANKEHPVVLSMLADHYFLTREIEEIMKAASKAMDLTTSSVIKANASYQIARAHHQMQEYENAYKFYAQAVEYYPEHLLSQFGLGQMKLKKGEYNPAIEIFEKLLKLQPESPEIMQILASLYGLVGKKDKSLELFNKLIDQANEDPFLAIEIAEMNEEKDSKSSLKYYEQSISILNDLPAEDPEVKQVKPEVLNNMAVLHQKTGNLNEAEHYYGLALQEIETAPGKDKHLKLTISYNLARLYEEHVDIEKATAIYRKIVEDYPGYKDAHLRLGAIQQMLGRRTDAIDYFKEVFDTDPNDPEAWIMIGQAQVLETDKLTKRSYERVLKDCDKDDIYTHVALGNYHSSVAREMKGDKMKKVKANEYKLAVNFYIQALRRDPTNVYAANGLAIVLADNGHVDEAQDLFTQVREADVKNPNAWVNLAHIYVEMKQYNQAIVMYENTLKKFFNNKDVNLILCLAKAQYLFSKMEKDYKMMYEAMKNTQKALLITPSDKTISYNLALVQQSYAQQVAELSQEERNSELLQQAKNCINSSQEIFQHLLQSEDQVIYDRKIVEQRQRYGVTLSSQVDRKIEEQRKIDKEKNDKLEAVRRKREEAEAKKKREQQEEENKRREEEARIEEERKRLMERVREENKVMAARAQEEEEDEREKDDDEGKKRRGRKRKEPVEEEDAEAIVQKEERKKYKTKRIIEDSDEDEL
ncbi:hypothetical protein BDF20DRAFT_873493 [Mycotypha africana]|uniref:uncharacterized protein n=1 Tax=Mycotypha africana TaxID=64632 RepID=UPI00230150D2|nr:uncharacterized protein BDF20DRAFT_873493 [Mycotypha africana]KAI8977189.1 hypothetical protein BDF20DRAFT_873493 [Mycotypha africana]